MKTLFFLMLSVVSLVAQVKPTYYDSSTELAGPTNLTYRMEGLTVRTQVSVGSPLEIGILTLSDSGTVTLTLEADVGLIFGPGTTNVLFRGTNDLIYTNGAATPRFIVKDGSGNFVNLGISSGNYGVVNSSAAVMGFQLGGTERMALSSVVLQPQNNQNLGSTTSPWNDTFINGELYVYGSGSGTTDYERLILDSTASTNGAIYNMTAGGTGLFRNQTFQIGGTNVMLLVPNNGWDGSTNKFLSASGVFYEVSGTSGGDTIWTNNAGVIQLIGGTNILLNPDVADGASAVAFSLNSSNLLSTSGAKLLTVGNDGTNVTFIHKNGGIDIGRNVGPYWNPDPSDMFAAVWDQSVGDSSTAYILGVATDSTISETKNGSFQWRGDSSSGFSRIDLAAKNGSQHTVSLLSDPNGGDTSVEIVIGFDSRLLLAPNKADGTTPYTYDTSLAHTSGNLMEVKNNGTNYYALSADGLFEQDAPSVGIYGNAGGTDDNYYSLSAGGGSAAITLAIGGNEPTVIFPSIEDGSTPYKFDTSLTHTSGNLAEFKNNGTAEFSIAAVTGTTDTGSKIFADNGSFSDLYAIGNIYTNFSVNNMTASSNYDAITVPAGLKALLIWGAYSTNSTSALVQVNLKVAGNYYMVSGTGTIHSTNANALQNTPFVFEPGDVISFFTDTTGPTILGALQLFSTNWPIKTARVTPMVSGTNVLYTAPANKIATRWGPPGVSSMNGAIFPFVRQVSGGSLWYDIQLNGAFVASKGVTTAATITTAATSLCALACIPAGQTLSLVSTNNNATQFAWMSVYEAPIQ